MPTLVRRLSLIALPTMAAVALTGCLPADNNNNLQPTPTPAPSPTPDLSCDIPLDEANATLVFLPDANGTMVQAVLELSGPNDCPVIMSGGQSVEIDGVALMPTGLDGQYAATLAADDTYSIRVSEPTRGSTARSIAGPGAFDITAPQDGANVDLAGFDVEWTDPRQDQTVDITLTQVVSDTVMREITLNDQDDDGLRSLSFNNLTIFGTGRPITIALTKQRVIPNFHPLLGNSTATLQRTTSIDVNP